MAATKELRFVLTGMDQGASKTLGGVASNASKMTATIGSGLSRLGSQIGGEFGDILSRAGEGFGAFGEHGTTALQKMTAAGAGIAGLGGVLIAMGSREKQASQQLDQAIQNTGHSMDEYGGQIEQTVKHMEHYGDTAVSTKDALATLTNATHDPAQALQRMQTAADLAAASHISLDAAASQVAKALGGSARIFKQYGIQVQTNADGTKDYSGAVDKLGQVLHGQADAATNTFTGHLHALATVAEDGVATFGQKYGPAVTAVGAAMTLVGPVVRGLGGMFKSSGTAAAEASTVISASEGESALAVEQGSAKVIAANEATTVSFTELGAAARGAGVSETTASGPKGGLAASVGKGGTLSTLLRAGIAGAIAAAVKEGFDTGITQLEKDGGVQKQIGDILGGLGGDPQKGSPGWEKTTSRVMKDVSNPLMNIKDIASGLGDLFGSHKKAAQAAHDDGDAQMQMAAQAEAATQKILDARTAELSAADAAQLLTKENEALNQEYKDLAQTALAADGTQNSFLDALDNVTTGLQQNGASLDQNSKKGRANREAFESALQAAVAHADAMNTDGAGIDQVNATLDKNVQQLIATAEQAGVSKDVVNQLVQQMELTPDQINTRFNVDTTAAYDAIQTLQGQALYLQNLLQSGDVSGYLQIAVRNESQFGGGGHAGGSDFYEGGSTLVGERGPERVRLPRGSKIDPYSTHTNGPAPANHFTINISAVDAHSFQTDQGWQRALIGALERALGSGMRITGLN